MVMAYRHNDRPPYGGLPIEMTHKLEKPVLTIITALKNSSTITGQRSKF